MMVRDGSFIWAAPSTSGGASRPALAPRRRPTRRVGRRREQIRRRAAHRISAAAPPPTTTRASVGHRRATGDEKLLLADEGGGKDAQRVGRRRPAAAARRLRRRSDARGGRARRGRRRRRRRRWQRPRPSSCLPWRRRPAQAPSGTRQTQSSPSAEIAKKEYTAAAAAAAAGGGASQLAICASSDRVATLPSAASRLPPRSQSERWRSAAHRRGRSSAETATRCTTVAWPPSRVVCFHVSRRINRIAVAARRAGGRRR